MQIAKFLSVQQYFLLGCALGLEPDDIDAIYQQHQANIINVIPKILLKWRDNRRRASSDEKAEELLRALRQLQLNETADNVEAMYKNKK